MDRLDCHCHVFNIVNVGLGAILKQLDSADERLFLIDKIKKLAELIRIFTGNSKTILDGLDKHYGKKYKLFPLMFDGDFLLESYREEHWLYIKGFFDEVEKSIRDKDIKQDIKVVLDFIEKLKTRKIGFEDQREELIELSQDPNYTDRIFPFLGVDPRRGGIKSYFVDNVGDGKVFAGIKVYPPNGFSPCDEVLVGKGSIFEYCSENQIPVVSHCSYGGFATLAMSIDVNGMIIPAGETEPKEWNGKCNFSEGLCNGFKKMVQERAGVLNNPKIWKEVLKKYNNLILVLAHFGNHSDEWQDDILRMLQNSDYPNLYTDVSCMNDSKILRKVRDIYYDNPDIQDKILYGSDYFMNVLKEDFSDYLNRMKRYFGKDMFES
ncbi:MAG: amidohydrolase family protein [Deltaproteobacteria bacterium]|nr:amidohydrolase family protein [Deltaproteobacteria bacterium]